MNVPTPHASWSTVLGLANSDHRLTLATHRPTPFKDVYTELSFASYVARGSNVSPYIGLIHTIQYETRQEQGLSLLLPSLRNDRGTVPPNHSWFYLRNPRSHQSRSKANACSCHVSEMIGEPSLNLIIPNDTKMFAQASAEPDVSAFVSADAEAKKVYDLLDDPGFEFVNIREYLKDTGF